MATIDNVIQAVEDRLDECDALLGELHRLIASVDGVDIGEDANLRKLRRVREILGDMRDEIRDDLAA